MDEILKDERFKHIAKDPRFKRIPRLQKKIKIDKRFQSMFEDKRFKLKYTVDKRGRPINKTTNEDLQKFYHLSSDTEDDEKSDSDQVKVEKSTEETKKSLKGEKKKLKQQRSVEDVPGTSHKFSKLDKKKVENARFLARKSKKEVKIEEDSESDEKVDEEEEDETKDSDKSDEDGSEGMRSDDEAVTDDVKAKLKDLSVDYARGEGALLSDSSSDELTEDEEDEESDLVHGWGELDKDAERVEESTRRLALCNMDWDRIRATDIMVLLNSFVPAGGLIHSVTVYPSEYGMERMKQEKEKGPLELYGEKEGSEEDDEDRDDKKYHMEKLRQYQLNRLKYFYAVIECDTVATADHLYKDCDGREYESSATRLDLRFIPDDTEFEQEPRERCTGMPDIRKYKPRNFLTTALQQSKVDMTWDETDPDRAALTSRVAAGDFDDDDLKAYLASSTEDESEEDDSKINKYKNVCKKNEKENEESEEERGNAKKDEEESVGEGESVEEGEGVSVEEGEGESVEEGEEESVEEGEGDSDDDAISKYRRALQSNAEEEEDEKKDIEMEVTWDVGLKKAAEEAVKKKMEEKVERTPFEEMMHRRREKKKEKQRKKAQEKGDEGEDGDESDDYVPADVDLNDSYFKEEYDKLGKETKKKKKKDFEETEEDVERKKWAQINSVKKARQKKTRRELEEEAAKESNFQVDVNDERFSALYTSHLFNIDPTDPNFRKTSGVEALINEKLDRRSKEPVKQTTSEPPKKKPRVENGVSLNEKTSEDNELSALVKSIKSKTQSLHNSKKTKQKDVSKR